MSHPAAEPASARLRRRAITLPGLFIFGGLLLCLSPLLLLVALGLDLLGRRRLGTSRALLGVLLLLVCETLGVLAAGLLWLASLLERSPERSEARYEALQRWWARTLLAGAMRIYRLEIYVEGAQALDLTRPTLLLARHASMVDTLLPSVYLCDPTGLRLRYVLKHELLWDPCFDLVGNRGPHLFVRRSSGDSDREVARVRALASDLGPAEGVLIYPEGTRFSEERRSRILARLREQESPDLGQASQLTHVLPPRRGGVLALLAAAPDAQVVAFVHHGLEGTRALSDLLRGALVGQRIDVAFWQVERPDPHADEAECSTWLFGLWQRMDAWLDARAAAP